MDPPQKHPLLAVNPNLPPDITTQQTTVVLNPLVMEAPAANPDSIISPPAPMHAPSLPQDPVRSINEALGDRAQVAAALFQLGASLSTRPDIDRNMANDLIKAQRLSAIDDVEMQMAAAPESLGVPLNPHPPFLVPASYVYASTTPEPGPSEARHDAYPGYLESEGEASNAENDQSNAFPSLPMSTPAVPPTGFSQPAEYVRTVECLLHSLILPLVCRNSFKIAIETFLTLTLPYKRVSKSSDCVILRIPSLEWRSHSCLTKYWE